MDKHVEIFAELLLGVMAIRHAQQQNLPKEEIDELEKEFFSLCEDFFVLQ